MKWKCFIVIISSLLILLGCASQEIKPPLAGEEAKCIIEVEVSDQILLY